MEAAGPVEVGRSSDAISSKDIGSDGREDRGDGSGSSERGGSGALSQVPRPLDRLVGGFASIRRIAGLRSITLVGSSRSFLRCRLKRYGTHEPKDNHGRMFSALAPLTRR